MATLAPMYDGSSENIIESNNDNDEEKHFSPVHSQNDQFFQLQQALRELNYHEPLGNTPVTLNLFLMVLCIV